MNDQPGTGLQPSPKAPQRPRTPEEQQAMKELFEAIFGRTQSLEPEEVEELFIEVFKAMRNDIHPTDGTNGMSEVTALKKWTAIVKAGQPIGQQQPAQSQGQRSNTPAIFENIMGAQSDLGHALGNLEDVNGNTTTEEHMKMYNKEIQAAHAEAQKTGKSEVAILKMRADQINREALEKASPKLKERIERRITIRSKTSELVDAIWEEVKLSDPGLSPQQQLNKAMTRAAEILEAHKGADDPIKTREDAIKASRERLAKATKDEPAKRDAAATKGMLGFLEFTPNDEAKLALGAIISRLPGVNIADGVIRAKPDKEMEKKAVEAFTNLDATMFAVTAQAMAKNNPKLTLTESIAALKKEWKDTTLKTGMTPAEYDKQMVNFNANFVKASEELGKLDAKQRMLYLIELARVVDPKMAEAMEQDLNRTKEEKKKGHGLKSGLQRGPAQLGL